MIFKKKHLTTIFLIISLISIITIGCSKDEDDPQSGKANFNVSLENSAAKSTSTVTSVFIDIQKVSIHTSSDTNTSSGWHELEANTGVYDLLDYSSGNDTLIGVDSVLSMLRVSQIRLVLGNNNSVVEDGITYDLETPSAQTSGLKIKVDATLEPNKKYKVVLDFDSDKSIKTTGNGKYKLQPVIGATLVQQ